MNYFPGNGWPLAYAFISTSSILCLNLYFLNSCPIHHFIVKAQSKPGYSFLRHLKWLFIDNEDISYFEIMMKILGFEVLIFSSSLMWNCGEWFLPRESFPNTKFRYLLSANTFLICPKITCFPGYWMIKSWILFLFSSFFFQLRCRGEAKNLILKMISQLATLV